MFFPDLYSKLTTTEHLTVENELIGGVTHIAAVVEYGVVWKKMLLKKARIRGCTADYVALCKASHLSPCIAQFCEYLGDNFTESIHLNSLDLEEFIDLKGLRDVASKMFDCLINSHPCQDFFLDPLDPGDPYVQRKMQVNGAVTAGQNCYVTNVIHRALLRSSDENWILPALVDISN
jgi:hypothetical protein